MMSIDHEGGGVKMRKNRSCRIVVSIVMIASLVMGALCLNSCGKKNSAQDEQLTMYVGLGNTGEYYPTIHDMILKNTGVDVKLIYSNTMDTTTAMFTRMEHYDLPADIVITAMSAKEDIAENALLDLASCTNLSELFTTTEIRKNSFNGKIYQLPYSTRLIGIEYNQTLMDEMGWTVPCNFQEMVELKKKADEAGIRFAVSGGAATGHGFNYLFHLMGSEYLSSPDGSEWYDKFMRGEADVSEFAEHAQYFKRYVEAGLFGEVHDQDWQVAEDYTNERTLFYYNILNDAFSTEGGDEFRSMPWLSENGSSNCFTTYNNMYLGLDKRLGEPENQPLLDKAVKVMEYMTTPEAVEVFTSLYQDGYVAVNGFEIDDTRLYKNFADSIHEGYTMHWYYNDFDLDSIVNVGRAVNDYIKGENDISFDDIMKELEYRRDNNLKDSSDVITVATKTFDYEDCAKLQAVAGALSAQDAVSMEGYNGLVTAALMPYTDDISKLEIGVHTPVTQEKIYQGDVEAAKMKSLTILECNNMAVITMVGQEINDLMETGFNGYPYVCITRDGQTPANNQMYWVAVSPKCLPEGAFEKYLSEGKVLMTRNSSEETPIMGNVEQGLIQYCQSYSSISPESIQW